MNKKIAVITGASRGIGKAVAEYLAEKGYTVALIARNEKLLTQVHDQIIAKGGNASLYVTDVSDSSQVKTCIENIVNKYQKIDLLFNNAAILKRGTSDISDRDIDELLQINLHGAIYIAKYVAEQMKKQKEGYIINMSSIGGKIAQSFSGIYAASKFGLTGFNEALAKEMSFYGVKVTSICPSMTATEMTAGRRFKPEVMIQTSDIIKTVEYLLGLSKNATPIEVIIHCLPFVEKNTQAINELFGLN